jgi:hypothetical protein
VSVVEFFLSNPLYIVEAVIIIAVGIYLVYGQLKKGDSPILQSAPVAQVSSFMPVGGVGKKKVIVLQTRDHRAYELPITREKELSIECPKKDDYTRRYYKSGAGFTLPNGNALFFALEGNAYTAVLKNDKNVTMRFPEALRSLWGDKVYDDMPPELRDPIEKHKFGVTIVPEKVSIEDKEGTLTPALIDDENDQKALDHLGKTLRNKGKMDWATFFQGGAVIGFIVYLLINFRVIPTVGA